MPTKGFETKNILALVDGEYVQIGYAEDFESTEGLSEIAEVEFKPDALTITADIKIDRRAWLVLCGAVTAGESRFSKKWRRHKSIKRRMRKLKSRLWREL